MFGHSTETRTRSDKNEKAKTGGGSSVNTSHETEDAKMVHARLRSSHAEILENLDRVEMLKGSVDSEEEMESTDQARNKYVKFQEVVDWDAGWLVTAVSGNLPHPGLSESVGRLAHLPRLARSLPPSAPPHWPGWPSCGGRRAHRPPACTGDLGRPLLPQKPWGGPMSKNEVFWVCFC